VRDRLNWPPPDCGSAKRALHYLLGELERLGRLERRPDPNDLRSTRVALTRRGTAAIGVIRDAVAEIETHWTQRLGAKRFAQLTTPKSRFRTKVWLFVPLTPSYPWNVDGSWW